MQTTAPQPPYLARGCIETTSLDEAECTDLGWASAADLHLRYPFGVELLSNDDLDLVHGYLHGLCGVFAIALCNVVGGDLVGVRVAFEDGAPRHVALRMGPDTYADARGLELTEAELVEGYGDRGTDFLIEAVEEETVMRRFLRHPAFYRAAADDVLVVHPQLAVRHLV